MREPSELMQVTGVTLRTSIERWSLSSPFRIAGYTNEFVDVLLVFLEKEGHVGRGEAAGVYYHHDQPASMLLQIESLRSRMECHIDVWLGVDANQGFTLHSLERLMATLIEARVDLIEQPFPLSDDALLDGFESPIPIAADESAQTLEDLPRLVGRFNVVNIKLDKCGGLTEGLAMARAASQLGLEPMVGNMLGTSLAMAPAYLVGQLCTIVDLDGPVFLNVDRDTRCSYENGTITCPQALWGQ